MESSNFGVSRKLGGHYDVINGGQRKKMIFSTLLYVWSRCSMVTESI